MQTVNLRCVSPNKDKKAINWRYIGNLVVTLRDAQIKEILEHEKSWASDIMMKHDIGCTKSWEKNFLFYKRIEDVFKYFPIKEGDQSFDAPKNDRIGYIISQMAGDNFPGALPAFLAWMWRDHFFEIKALYDLVEL